MVSPSADEDARRPMSEADAARDLRLQWDALSGGVRTISPEDLLALDDEEETAETDEAPRANGGVR